MAAGGAWGLAAPLRVGGRGRLSRIVLRGGSHHAGAVDTLAALRLELRAREVDAVVIPTDDPHLSEYVAPCFERRARVSGFTGSAGTAVVTADRALCWTDSRYWLQAERELGAGWTLMRAGSPGVDDVADWFGTDEGAAALGEFGRVGIDASCTSAAFASKLRVSVGEARAVVPLASNPVDAVWADRPRAPAGALRVHPPEYAGEAVAAKLARVRALVADAGADALAVTTCDDVAWLYNVRGSDVACNPVALSYALVEPERATLFVDDRKVDAAVRAHLADAGVAVAPYDRFLAALEAVRGKVALDPNRSSEAVVAAVPEARRVAGPSPVAALKAVKNAVELDCMRAAHVRDGAAACRAFAELGARVGAGERVDEVDVDAILQKHRGADPRHLEPSFPTIAGSGPNGAIVHYSAARPGCGSVTADKMLLVDSGAQYADGTTDVTRTMHFGAPTAAEKRAYTAVLKGHIGLDTCVFPEKTAGFVVDAFARRALWALGMDYGHGTGHGVGAALNVHEGPISISPRFSNHEPLKAGMVVSNEPGYYEAGAFGIRIENLLAIEAVRPADDDEKAAFLKFDALTLIPIDRTPIDVGALDAAEVAWLDAYHAKVRAKLSPLLADDARALAWLTAKTEPLTTKTEPLTTPV